MIVRSSSSLLRLHLSGSNPISVVTDAFYSLECRIQILDYHRYTFACQAHVNILVSGNLDFGILGIDFP